MLNPQKKLEVLVKLEDNSNSSVLDDKDNWILIKGLDGARVAKPPDDWEAPALKKRRTII